MKITAELLDTLTAQAKASPRLRMNYDLRTCASTGVGAGADGVRFPVDGWRFPVDSSQRMLNALEPGTQVPIHRHMKSTETVVLLRGRAIQYYYNDEGEVIDQILLESGGACSMMCVEVGQWHRLDALESGTVIFEAKDGAYEPMRAEDVMGEVR